MHHILLLAAHRAVNPTPLHLSSTLSHFTMYIVLFFAASKSYVGYDVLAFPSDDHPKYLVVDCCIIVGMRYGILQLLDATLLPGAFVAVCFVVRVG